MLFIKNLPIRSKLLLILLIPLAALLYFLVQNILDEIAAGYLLSKGKEEKSDLFARQGKTDNTIFNLTQLLYCQAG